MSLNVQKQCLLPLYSYGGMTKAAPMQDSYHTKRCKRLQQSTEANSDSNSMPPDTGLMNKTSGAPQSRMSTS